MTTVDEAEVRVRREGPVGVVTMNRPGARNALNSALLTGLQSAFDAFREDTEIRVVVLTGAGTAFCAGADLKESAANVDADLWARRARASQSMRIHQQLPNLPQPVIAAVNGPAVAGGCGLAMSCDVVFASTQALFGYPEVGRGLVAAMAMVSLSRVVGRRVALDLLLSGRHVSAEEALELGLVNRVVAHQDLMGEVLAYAAEMATSPLSALCVTKTLFHQVAELDYDRALEHARDVNVMVARSQEAIEGVSAFGASPDPGRGSTT